MSRKALVLLVCCCDFRDGAERLIPSKSLGNAVIRAFPGLFRILRMCAPRHAAAVVRPRERKKSADRRRRILISRLLIIRASVPRRKSPFPAYFKGFPAVSLLIPPYPAFLKYPVSPHRATTSLTRCPPCCRLWAVVRPRRAEVGYGYPPGLFGRVLGSFSVRRKRSRRKGRRRGRPRPGHFCPQCGQLRRSTSGVVEGDFRRAAGSRTEMIPQLREKLRGRGKISRRKMK